MFPSPAPKNPSVDKISFQALERRVAALEAIIGPIVAINEEKEQAPKRGRPAKDKEE